MEKRSSFQHVLLEEKKKNTDPDLTLFTNVNSKRTIDLNVNHKTIKLPGGNGRKPR